MDFDAHCTAREATESSHTQTAGPTQLVMDRPTLLAIAGIFMGNAISKKLAADKLKTGFGWFVLVMGIYIIVKELFFPGTSGH